MAYSRKARVPRPSSGAPRRKTRERGVETAREQQAYDPGPWFPTPESSRVSRARYDSKNQIMEVDWVDGGLQYVYMGVPPSVWANFKRAVSKGKFVNRVLNQYSYAPKVD